MTYESLHKGHLTMWNFVSMPQIDQN
jgi:hypothetical protein